MKLDVVNEHNEKIGTVDVSNDVFGGRVRAHLIWESVVHMNAAERRGTHATKTRAQVSGSGRKPWRQKGTGRARVGEIRNPLWRKGGTVFGPQPRAYGYPLPRKVRLGALSAALAQKLRDGQMIVVDRLAPEDARTKTAVALLGQLGGGPSAALGAGRSTLLVDVAVDEKLARAARNLGGVQVVSSGRLTARDVMRASRVVTTRAAIEQLQEVLAS